MLGMHHEEHVWKARTKVRPVDIMMPVTFRCVRLHTSGTVEFHHGFADHFGETDLRIQAIVQSDSTFLLFAYRQHGLIVAVNTRTEAKLTVLEFLEHLGNANVGENVTSMDKA